MKQVVKQVQVENIVYDTDGHNIDLPTKMNVEIELWEEDVDDEFEINDAISDAISDKTDWLVESFTIVEIK